MAADIGLIGLAVMGENLVMNMESKGFTVAVYNRTTSKVTSFVEGRAKGKNIIGTYSLLWGILPFSLEIDQTFIGAILTCIGYSINDKVVIFDRVREYLQLYPNREKQLLFNQSLNSTLARTINTSTTTLVVLLVIIFFGGASIRSFAFAMILGVVYGTLSSLFIAAPLAYLTIKGHKNIKADEDIRIQDAQDVKA